MRRVAVTFIMGLDCIVDCEEPSLPEHEEAPAPIFALEVPSAARANERFSLNAWVYLDGDEPAEALASSFVAEVDEQTRTITVTGRIRRTIGGQVRPDAPRIQRALVVGIAACAPAGDWIVRVPAAYWAGEAAVPACMEAELPPPVTAWSLAIR